MCLISFISDAFAWSADHATVLSAVISAIAAVFIARFTVILSQISHQQNEVTKTTQRAFVFLEDFAYEKPMTTNPIFVTRFTVKPKWRNNGYTPTKNMKIFIGWGIVNGDLPAEFGYTYSIQSHPMFLGPQTTELSEAIEITDINKIVKGGMGSNDNLFIWGRADYGDTITESPHFIEWCYKLRLSSEDGKTLSVSRIQWKDHNRSDEDKNEKS